MKILSLTLALTLAFLAAASLPVRADDTEGALKAGGLVLEPAGAITLVSEDLYLSERDVRVDYQFRNPTGADIEATLTFPMPDLVGAPTLAVSIPDPAQANFLAFEATVDGQAVPWQLDQHAFLMREGQAFEITDELKSLGIPLIPTVAATAVPLRRLSEQRRKALIEAGFLDRQVHRDGTISDVPLWTLKSRYARRQVFPAGRGLAIHQSFTPSLGGQSSLSFGSPDLGPAQMARYADKFCTDPAFARTAQALYRRASADGSRFFQAYEQYLTYVMPTGIGAIGTFRLIVDKGDPATLLAFCASPLRKTGPTTVELVVKDYVPRRDIDVLFLKSAPRVSAAPPI
ncbi:MULTISPECIES: DUF4424 family protein [unclassified Methylobacterium]|jgi:hypothetical protein|uniref:DUF4424 family protein n=1 Tax=unclassified Methylobacterium TaxID=2615210 RepID=UPI001354892B|nr:DUF4424 family protein [Methylobacterium sp. 2A]MWV23098.1 DUF4424 domain-containing protein [Methylobacterium sp. 2A]